MKLYYKIALFVVLPIVYCFSKDYIVEKWNEFESFVALISLIITVYYYSYSTDIKVYFFINRILSVFKFAHTDWIFSAKFTTDKSKSDVLNNIISNLVTNRNQLKFQDNDFLEIIIDNSFLLKFSIQPDFDLVTICVTTSKITVPTTQTKNKAIYISNLMEEIESAIIPIKEKDFSIEIEYSDKSPYYSYWIKKLPEEMIYNFNCSIKIPNTSDSSIRVNKNKITISSHTYSKVFELTRDYVSLQPMI